MRRKVMRQKYKTAIVPGSREHLYLDDHGVWRNIFGKPKALSLDFVIQSRLGHSPPQDVVVEILSCGLVLLSKEPLPANKPGIFLLVNPKTLISMNPVGILESSESLVEFKPLGAIS
jgi:hypothetical protein